MSTHLVMVRSTRRARDLWRTRYWVDCVHCDMRTGPHTAADAAMAAAVECPHEQPMEYLCPIHGPTPWVNFRKLSSREYEPECVTCDSPVTPIYTSKEENAWRA